MFPKLMFKNLQGIFYKQAEQLFTEKWHFYKFSWERLTFYSHLAFLDFLKVRISLCCPGWPHTCSPLPLPPSNKCWHTEWITIPYYIFHWECITSSSLLRKHQKVILQLKGIEKNEVTFSVFFHIRVQTEHEQSLFLFYWMPVFIT